MDNVIKRMNEHQTKLTKNDIDILSYLINQVETIKDMPINEIALLTHVSQSTLVRLAQKLEYSGFTEFRFHLKSSSPNQQKNIQEYPNTQLLELDIQNTLSLLKKIDLSSITRAIHDCQRIFIYGTGWGEKNAASDLTRNFLSSGIFLTKFPSLTELKWNRHLISDNDLIIIISFSGENDELIDIISELKMRQVNICSITPLHQNRLSQLAHYSLYYHFTDLSIKHGSNDYNLFVTLYMVTDALFRRYLDDYGE